MLAAAPASTDLRLLGLMQPVPGTRPFTRSGWSFELPLHGHRVLAIAAGEHSVLLTPGGLDVSRRFPEVLEALRALPPGRHGLDGELCVLDVGKRNDVHQLHERALARSWRPGMPEVTLVVLDVLMLRDEDLRPLPWRERRRAFKAAMAECAAPLRLQRTMPCEGDWLHRQAVALGRPWLHARRVDAPYVAGRSEDWLSIPCTPAHAQALPCCD